MPFSECYHHKLQQSEHILPFSILTWVFSVFQGFSRQFPTLVAPVVLHLRTKVAKISSNVTHTSIGFETSRAVIVQIVLSSEL
jgi:hypothetical protein